MKHLNKILLLSAALLACSASAQTKLTWSHNSPEDKIEKYVLQHRTDLESEWKSVEILMPQNVVEIPESTDGRWFRIAATNSFGWSLWTEPVRVPYRVRALKLVIEIEP